MRSEISFVPAGKMAKPNLARDTFFKIMDELAGHSQARQDVFMEVTNSLTERLDKLKVAVSDYVETGVLDLTDIRSTTTEENHAIKVKKEKLSEALNASSSTEPIVCAKIKEEMPAPTAIPPKKKGKKAASEQPSTRSTRTKTKQILNIRDSDVIVQNTAVPTVNLSDSEDSDTSSTRSARTAIRNQKENVEITETVTRNTRTKKKKELKVDEPLPIRSTRSKATKKNLKENLVEEPAKSEAKRSRSRSDNRNTKKGRPDSQKVDKNSRDTTQTVYEDAQSEVSPEKPANATFVSNSQGTRPLQNTTMVLDTASCLPSTSSHQTRFNIFDKEPSVEPMFTDDESQTKEKTPPPKKIGTGKKLAKEVFSPFEKTTTKKKVEAFEKLYNGSEIPIRNPSSAIKPNNSALKEKAKLATPSYSKFLPSMSSSAKTTGSIKRVPSSSTVQDPREVHRKMLEKEQALKKKEARLQAEAEAKRKMNEEKQLKALQHRKALEAEKQKLLELHKMKEEDRKLREQRRDEQRREEQQRLEMERKRQAAQRKKQQNMPIYMTTSAPKLPTEDCYDSDDPGYNSSVPPPSWSHGAEAELTERIMMVAGNAIQNTLFCCHPQTISLVDIFQDVSEHKLKRTSSQHWKDLPRYTMIPDLNETTFSDDEI